MYKAYYATNIQAAKWNEDMLSNLDGNMNTSVVFASIKNYLTNIAYLTFSSSPHDTWKIVITPNVIIGACVMLKKYWCYRWHTNRPMRTKTNILMSNNWTLQKAIETILVGDVGVNAIANSK